MTKKGIFSFFFSMFFILMMANPALTNEDGFKGICMGGGEWSGLVLPLSGNTAFLMRANFPGNASGGHVYVSFTYMNNEFYLVVDVDPEFSTILYDTWPLASGASVEGQAFWGIGPVVDTDFGPYEGKWALVGAYDGSESDESDYLLASAGILNKDAAKVLYDLAVAGDIELQVVLDEGNARINVMEEEP